MQYVIDGHNLIPHVPGLSLSDLEDEQALIERLVAFCRQKRARITVFFDQAAQGFSGRRNHGLVLAVFVPSSSNADKAIADYIRNQGASARDLTVVSSDRMVQAAVREHRARVLSSPDFAALLESARFEVPPTQANMPTLTPEELKEWEELFNQYGAPPDGLIP